MPFQGNLQDFKITQLLHVVSLSQQSGSLVFYHPILSESTLVATPKPRLHGIEQAAVSFHKGNIVAASLSSANNSLIAILYRAGKLTDQQANRLQEQMQPIGEKTLAVRLISNRWVTRKDIVTSVRDHIEDVIYNLIACTEGTFRFEQKDVLQADRVFVPVEVNRAIAEGKIHAATEQKIQRFFKSLDVKFRFAANVKQRVKGIHLTSDEWKVVMHVTPGTSLRRMMQTLDVPERHIKKIAYNLVQAGILEIIPSAKTTQTFPSVTVPAKQPPKPEAEARTTRLHIITRLIKKFAPTS